jgi:UDP-perosamine 4-acetyltransferase
MTDKISCIILGAGGHARVLIDCFRFDTGVSLVGILDSNPDLFNQTVDGILVLGNDELLNQLPGKGVSHFTVGLGGVGNNLPRQTLFELALAHGLMPLTVRHPSAIISSGAVIDRGCQLLPGCIVNTGARLGLNVLINSGAIIEHDCVVMDHAHISTGAKLAGGVNVGIGAHVGAGATVRQNIRIGAAAIIGAGAVVVKDVEPHETVIGVPARILDTVKL